MFYFLRYDISQKVVGEFHLRLYLIWHHTAQHPTFGYVHIGLIQ